AGDARHADCANRFDGTDDAEGIDRAVAARAAACHERLGPHAPRGRRRHASDRLVRPDRSGQDRALWGRSYRAAQRRALQPVFQPALLERRDDGMFDLSSTTAGAGGSYAFGGTTVKRAKLFAAFI